MNSIFMYEPTLGEHHPIYSLIEAMTVTIDVHPTNAFTRGVSVMVPFITIAQGTIKYTILVDTDIIPDYEPDSISINHNMVKGSVEKTTESGITIKITNSGITVPDGVYNVNMTLRLTNVRIYPTSVAVISDTVDTTHRRENHISLEDGYNVSVSWSGDTIVIDGGPGLGRGKYTKGGVDKLYNGLRSINGLNNIGNINMSVTDLISSNKGSIQ